MTDIRMKRIAHTPVDRTWPAKPPQDLPDGIAAQEAFVVGNVDGVEPVPDPQFEAGKHGVASGEHAGGREEMLDEPHRSASGQLIECVEGERQVSGGDIVEKVRDRAELQPADDVTR